MNNSYATEVLTSFAQHLWHRLSHPTFSGPILNGAVYNNSFTSVVPLGIDEIRAWDKRYCIMDGLRAAQAKLVVPMGVNSRSRRETYRVNMVEPTYQPVARLKSPDLAKFFIQTYAHVGFMGNQPYNAFISQHIYVKNGQNRWIFDEITGAKGVYARYSVAGADLWFGLHPDVHQPNRLKVSINRPEYMMLSMDLNRKPEADDEMDTWFSGVDCTDRTNFFFWQVRQFMEPNCTERRRKPLM